MLSLLHIENIAVIEQADIELNNGLTVLTGETGAGKSIILDAISALMGQRTSRELIRSGAAQGFVSAVFTNVSSHLIEQLNVLELTGEDPNVLHIQRKLTTDGKTVCRVNMKPVSVSVLKTLSPFLLNIHGQHDGQKLMDQTYHIDFLDSYCGTEKLLFQYQAVFQKLIKLKRQLSEMDKTDQNRLERIETLRYHVDEIDAAMLREGEEEQLAESKRFYDHAGELLLVLEKANVLLGGDEDTTGAVDGLAAVAEGLRSVENMSDELRVAAERAEEIKYLASDLRYTVSNTLSRTEFSAEERVFVEERLDLIYSLRRKYGSNIHEILDYAAQARQELEQLTNLDQSKDELRNHYQTEIKKAKKMAQDISQMRLQGGATLEKEIISELYDLDMKNVRFQIKIVTGAKLTIKGLDTVEFLISVNPGEDVKPLSKVASGGELSRIMLSMKNVLTCNEPVETLIFDEIDTGVSGKAAQKIARKLSEIGSKKQTLCVTHLPQIAAMGNNHLLIEKCTSDERSFTAIFDLNDARRVQEIARMLAGDSITDAALNNARALLYEAGM